MSYTLPKSIITEFSFNFNFDLNQNHKLFFSQSLRLYLNNIKLKIDKYLKEWDIYKKYTNPYEYIHTPPCDIKYPVCNYKPLSRSFYKMIEIIHTFKLLNEPNSINTFHLAEGPGGFIQAFSYIRNNKNDIYNGITLISNNKSVPGWNKTQTYLNDNSNIIIEFGPSKTGNIFCKENIIYFYKNFYNKCNYVTGDGGVDYSSDFNNQEYLSGKLILIQILYAIIIQKKGGCFILKIFDIFNKLTIDMLYILNSLYETVHIIKPNTSRIANSEKYIICKQFKGINIYEINNIIENFDNITNNNYNIICLFDYKIPRYFINKIEEINAIYGQIQIENINYTLNLIRSITNSEITCDKIQIKLNTIKNKNIIKCINWCKKYNLPINDYYLNLE